MLKKTKKDEKVTTKYRNVLKIEQNKQMHQVFFECMHLH